MIADIFMAVPSGEGHLFAPEGALILWCVPCRSVKPALVAKATNFIQGSVSLR